MSRKSFCYKTLETYDKPRDQLKSFCRDGGNSGYYNISSTRGICNDDGDCRVKENFQPIPATAWQQPASVRGTWDQVEGLYELNPQTNSCVSDWKNREGYGNAATGSTPPTRPPYNLETACCLLPLVPPYNTPVPRCEQEYKGSKLSVCEGNIGNAINNGTLLRACCIGDCETEYQGRKWKACVPAQLGQAPKDLDYGMQGGGVVLLGDSDEDTACCIPPRGSKSCEAIYKDKQVHTCKGATRAQMLRNVSGKTLLRACCIGVNDFECETEYQGRKWGPCMPPQLAGLPGSNMIGGGVLLLGRVSKEPKTPSPSGPL